MTKTQTMTLAARLKAAPFTRSEIAELIGVDRGTLWRWARANQVLKARYVQPLADILGCSAADLMEG